MSDILKSLIDMLTGMPEVVKCLTVLIAAMSPILEVRASIPIGYGFGFSLWKTLIISILGNMFIIPFVVLLFTRIMVLLKKIKLTAKLAEKLELRAERNSKKVEGMVFLGLMFFVAIPLPGTGAWTASMIAGILHVDIKKAFPPIAIGVICASVIVSLLTYGLLDFIIGA